MCKNSVIVTVMQTSETRLHKSKEIIIINMENISYIIFRTSAIRITYLHNGN